MTAEFDPEITKEAKKKIEALSSEIKAKLKELEPSQPKQEEEPLSQETSSVEEETLLETIEGKLPIICNNCRTRSYSKNLTTCGVCGSSEVVPAVIIHFCEPCDKEDRDVRWAKSGHCFRIPCQPKANVDTPTPSYLTAVLSATSCPKCLNAFHVKVDKRGVISNLTT
jgi:hypothetical protein